jgi:hypothetical protein
MAWITPDGLWNWAQNFKGSDTPDAGHESHSVL